MTPVESSGTLASAARSDGPCGASTCAKKVEAEVGAEADPEVEVAVEVGVEVASFPPRRQSIARCERTIAWCEAVGDSRYEAPSSSHALSSVTSQLDDVGEFVIVGGLGIGASVHC